MSSSSQFPISPPDPQNGRSIAWKSPHLRSRKALMKSPRSRSGADGRMTSHWPQRAMYVSGL
jgi:hypothetical protein